jgi:hypothetical protein
MKAKQSTHIATAFVFAVVLAGLIRPLSWIIAEWSHCPKGMCTVSGTPPEWDFAVFWKAGHAALMHDFGGNFSYPPTTLLFFAPLGMLPLRAAYLVWNLLGVAALMRAMSKAGLGVLGCLIVLLSPAFLYNVLLGQNGAFSSALLIAALVTAPRRPILAGGLAAILTLKPQLGLLIPMSWLAERRWRAIIVAAFGAVALVALSVLIFGPQPWHTYLTVSAPAMKAAVDAPPVTGVPGLAITPFLLSRVLGFSAAWAHWFQLVVSVSVMALTYRLWRAPLDIYDKLITTLFLCLLAMPYGGIYDMIGYSVALALLVQRNGSSPLWAIFWIWPAYARDVTVTTGFPLTPLVICAAAYWSYRLARSKPQALA